MRVRHSVGQLSGPYNASIDSKQYLKVGANILQFTWARKPDWSHFYSSSEEIWQYLRDVVDKFDLMKYMKLSHKIIGAQWDNDRGVWDLQIKNLVTGVTFTDTAEIFINGGGILKLVSSIQRCHSSCSQRAAATGNGLTPKGCTISRGYYATPLDMIQAPYLKGSGWLSLESEAAAYKSPQTLRARSANYIRG